MIKIRNNANYMEIRSLHKSVQMTKYSPTLRSRVSLMFVPFLSSRARPEEEIKHQSFKVSIFSIEASSSDEGGGYFLRSFTLM